MVVRNRVVQRSSHISQCCKLKMTMMQRKMKNEMFHCDIVSMNKYEELWYYILHI